MDRKLSASFLLRNPLRIGRVGVRKGAKNMQLDPVRLKILQLIQKAGSDMKAASRAIGKNPAYLQQFLFRGTPKALSGDTRAALADFLGVDEGELEHSFALPREARTQGRPTSNDNLVTIPEVEVRASAGAGALNEETPEVVANWRFPRALIEQELRTSAKQLRLLSVRGDSMLPTLSDGDRILVDISHNVPSPPGIYVLWDGSGLVAKRVDVVPGEQARIRLHSDNTRYSAYDCDAEEINIVGRVVLAAKRL
jgi:phage repressor protein C with HTH and peptisase S24 domain